MISAAIWAAIIWVLAATATAFLPIARQYAPGLCLLIAAPFLIVWLGATHGWLVSGLSLLAFLSMFRKPLRYLVGRARGRGGVS